MSKQHKIRWTSSDNKELARVVRNYNAKIKRLAENPSRLRNSVTDDLNVTDQRIKNSLPERTSVKELKELINTRQDLKRELNALQRFTKKGSEELVIVPDTNYNILVTKWQKKEMAMRVANINRKRQRRLERMQETELFSRGESLGYTLGQIGMGRIEEVSLRPMKAFYKGMSQSDLAHRFKAIRKESQSDFFTKKDYQVRDNYIAALKMNYSYNEVKDIIDHIEKQPIEEFLKVFYREGATFEWVSPGGKIGLEEDEYDSHVEYLRSVHLPNTSKNSSDIINEELTKKQGAKTKTKKKPKKKVSKKRG